MQEYLTYRERQVLALIARGKSTKEIARELDITFKTASSHRYSAQAKLGANNAPEMIYRAIQLGLISVIPEGRDRRGIARLAEIVEEQLRELETLRTSLAESRSLRQRCSELRSEYHSNFAEMRSIANSLLRAGRSRSVRAKGEQASAGPHPRKKSGVHAA